MVLEFDSEVALLQTAFQEIQRQHGDLMSCDLSVILKALPIFNETITDIEQNRRDDNISWEVVAHRDRKLVCGIFYSVLRLKLGLTSSQSEYFEALEDVYPNFDWPLLLGLIAVGRWHDHIQECFEATHPSVFGHIVEELLPLIADTKQTFHVPILVRILSLLMYPTKARELSEVSGKAITASNGKILVPPLYEDLVNKVFDLVVKHLLVQQSWAAAVCYDFLLALFQRLCQMLQCNFQVRSVNLSSSYIAPETCSMSVNEDNISEVHSAIFKSDAHSAETQQPDSHAIPALHLQERYTELCYETLTSLNWKEFLKSRPYLKLLSCSRRRRRMTELKCCFIEVHGICRALFQEKGQVPEELLVSLNLVYQQLDPYCQFFDELGRPIEDIVNIIDERDMNYSECVNQIVAHPGLQDNKEWLNCLVKNAELLDRSQVQNILNKVKNETRNSTASEQLKEIIIKAFTFWPAALQQDFQLELLQKQSTNDVLKMKQFSKDLTVTFNKVVHTEVEDQALKTQIACLCLQSPSEVLLQAMVQAVQSNGQINLAFQVLSSVSHICQYRRTVHGPSVLGEVLKEVISENCQTEVHTQNLKELIYLLLQSSVTTCVEVFYSSVLPFLDKWNLDDECGKLLLAFILLQVILEFESSQKSEAFIKKLQPCGLLLYLGNIVFQCKIICDRPNTMWVQVKTIALDIIKVLINGLICNRTNISRKEIMWLQSKLQKVDETLSFYYLDLFEYYNVDLEFGSSMYYFEFLLEFAYCSPSNAKAVEPWFDRLIPSLKHGAEAQLVAALCKVLPACLPEEWKNLLSILEFVLSCDNSPVIVTTVSSTLTPEAKLIVGVVHLFCQAIILCNAAGKDTQHMVHCLNLVIQEKLLNYETLCKKPETVIPMLAAELSVEVCQLLRKLPTASALEGGVLLMAISRACLKSTSEPNKTALKVIFAGISTLPSPDLRQNLFKTFSCFSPVVV